MARGFEGREDGTWVMDCDQCGGEHRTEFWDAVEGIVRRSGYMCGTARITDHEEQGLTPQALWDAVAAGEWGLVNSQHFTDTLNIAHVRVRVTPKQNGDFLRVSTRLTVNGRDWFWENGAYHGGGAAVAQEPYGGCAECQSRAAETTIKNLLGEVAPEGTVEWIDTLVTQLREEDAHDEAQP